MSRNTKALQQRNMNDAAVSYNWIDGLPIVSGKFDISDEPGKRVLAKIDGGPGQQLGYYVLNIIVQKMSK
eukprot:15365548-Ditylum_brightwellii.AAC.1